MTAETAVRAEPRAPDRRDAPAERARGPERGVRFDDPHWDDEFCAWWDPALRTCCG